MPTGRFILAALALAALAAPAAAEVLPAGWEYRRQLIFKQAPSDAPGENIAWVECYTNGKQLPDGADFRVTTPDRVVLLHKILQVSPAHDFVRIAFATKSDGPYELWWGNPKAEKPARELEIHRGILLDVMRAAPGKGVSTDVPPLASFFINDMSLGFNPLGDDFNVVLHYSAQFKIDRAIKPLMAFTVSDIGILGIDGQTEAQEKGGLKARVRDPFAVDLSVGWHSLDIRQMNTTQAGIAMALAWQRPGEAAYTTLPQLLFAPVAHAVPGNIERAGNAPAPDMVIEPAAEGFIQPSTYVQRYIFDAQFPATLKPTITWDFGDGQVSKGLKKVSHIFLSPGIYPVTLKLELNAATPPLTITTRVEIKDRMYARFPRPVEDPPKTMQAVLKDYDAKKLPADQALRGLVFFETARDDDNTIAWARAWLAATDKTALSDALVSDESFSVARLLLARKDPRGAADIYRLASAKPIGLEARQKLMRMEVMTLCDDVDDSAAALQLAQDWEKQATPGDNGQRAIIKAAEAYAAIARGDAKTAQAAVDAAVAATHTGPAAASGAAAAGATVTNVTLNQQVIRQGVLARNIENYIRTRDFDTAWQLVNQWDLEFPAALWEGFSRTLRVRLAAAEGHNLTAAHMALAHAKTNPDGFYAAELLFAASENFKQAGQADQAKVVMDLLKSKYPESPYARQ